MIRAISNSITKEYGKRNWIDQNSVVFGYSDSQQCCEDFGWGVYDPSTREKVAIDPSGLDYHFDFAGGTREVSVSGKPTDSVFCDTECIDTLDCVQIVLVHDLKPDRKLVFECWTNHNGYYMHDFSFRQTDIMGKSPRLFIIRGKPGSGKSTLAKKYDCIHIEEDMFAISGGRYHWNNSDGSGIKALANFGDIVGDVMEKRCDIVISSVLPFCTEDKNDKKGYALCHILQLAKDNGYEVYCSTLETVHGNAHGCPSSVYDDIFLSHRDLKAQIGRVFGEQFVESIHWYDMPTDVMVDK